MVKETKTRNTKRSPDVVARDYTINLHKRLHGWYPFPPPFAYIALHTAVPAYFPHSVRRSSHLGDFLDFLSALRCSVAPACYCVTSQRV